MVRKSNRSGPVGATKICQKDLELHFQITTESNYVNYIIMGYLTFVHMLGNDFDSSFQK